MTIILIKLHSFVKKKAYYAGEMFYQKFNKSLIGKKSHSNQSFMKTYRKFVLLGTVAEQEGSKPKFNEKINLSSLDDCLLFRSFSKFR